MAKPFDVEGARAAGYSDVEIADHLASESKFDIAGARKAGYSDSEIIGHLSQPKAAPADPRMAGVPQVDAQGNVIREPKPTQPDSSLVDKIKGVGETALSLATGATGGTLGMVGGALGGLAGAVATGEFGTPQGVSKIEQAAGDGATALTYQPRTEAGQEYTQGVGEALNTVLPVTVMPELAAVSAGTRAAASSARDVAAPAVARAGSAAKNVATGAVERIRQTSPEIAARIERTLGRNPDPTPTPGTRGSMGAAGTDMATQRQQVADKVGVDLTLGQATRDQNQLRFEQETGKGEQGAALRERWSDQNEQVLKHFDNLVDQTGKETPDLAATGRSVDSGLRAGLDYDKTRVRVAYKAAEKSAEGAAPVTLDAAIQYLNDSAPDAAVSPLLDVARKRAIRLGAATEDADGNLVAQPTTVRNAELLRRAIGNATDYEPTNIRNSAILKGAIDSATEPVIGPKYRQARRLRENLAKKYEDRGVVASLLNTKKGMADRKVAIADVFEHSILNASREDVGAVRRALTHGKDAPPEVVQAGQQAWRDLQGETMNWIKDQAFANTATDQRGNVILSVPKLDKAIKRLDADGRLQTIFGKQGAQHLRDLNDLAKVIYTTPPGAVNTSNTASVLLAAFAEAGVTGSMTGLPVPVLSTLRVLSKQVKNRQLQKRIEIALTRGRAAANNNPPAARPTGATLH
ncbi:hypothetical protein [Massilia sp. CT11-137]|uniref:hypothetical protein n=1 Tax=Massilia sp. CT11-137 TaxID=3393901 RepID=UPI0039AFDAEC